MSGLPHIGNAQSMIQWSKEVFADACPREAASDSRRKETECCSRFQLLDGLS